MSNSTTRRTSTPPEPAGSAPEKAESAALMSALVTEHFVLQSAASATISESGSRSAIYLATLSSGLVAIGFASSSPAILAALAFTIFPTIFAIGWFTVVRLVDTTVENVTAQRRIERIRRHYASLTPSAPLFFSSDDEEVSGELGVRYSRWSILSTMATMIAVVNSVVAGAAGTLLLSSVLALPTALVTLCGVALGALFLTATLVYQWRRLTAVAGRP